MIKKELFGKLPCGCEVYAYTLSNDSITSVCILNYGGILKNIWVKDKAGRCADVICGYDSLEGYLTAGGYQGALIGRIGNRIAGGKFTLEGKEYQIFQNDGKNSLHGGKSGFNAKIWDGCGHNTCGTRQVTVKLQGHHALCSADRAVCRAPAPTMFPIHQPATESCARGHTCS